MARWDDKSAKCPFFEESEAKYIVCEGVDSATKTHLQFTSSSNKKAYKTTYCDDIGGCRSCRISRMLMEKYETRK